MFYKKESKQEGNGPLDSQAKVMISDKKCGPIYLKPETLITAYAFCIGLTSQNRRAMENLLTNLRNWTLISQFSTIGKQSYETWVLQATKLKFKDRD